MSLTGALPIVGIVIALHAARRWLFKERISQRAPLEGGVYVLRKARISGWIAIGVAVLSAVLWLLLRLNGAYQSPDDLHLSVLLLAIIIFVAGAMWANVFGYQYKISAQYIEIMRFWRHRTIEWASVEAIKSTHVPYFIVIRCRDKTSVMVSLLMQGSGTLVEHILEVLPGPVLETDPELHLKLLSIRERIKP